MLIKLTSNCYVDKDNIKAVVNWKGQSCIKMPNRDYVIVDLPVSDVIKILHSADPFLISSEE